MYCKDFVGKADENGNWLPLTAHLYDTAGVMKHLLREWTSDTQIAACQMEEGLLYKTAIFAAGIHDLGKMTSYFQGLITGKNLYLADRLETAGFVLCQSELFRGKTPHSYAGQWILQSEIFDIPESFAGVIGAHHGTPITEPAIYGSDDMLAVYALNFYGKERDKQQKLLWESTWKEAVSNALRTSGFETIEEIPEITVEAQILITALLIVTDWIASNTYYFPLIDADETLSEADCERRVEEGWKRLHFPEGWESEISRMNKALFVERFHFEPNDMQKAVYQAVNEVKEPGIFILEAHMGIGKTEAALCAAEIIAAKCHLKGMFFGLPTQATCNGIYKRLYSWADTVSEDTRSAIQLAHAGAMYDKEYRQQVMKGQALVDDENIETGTLIHPWFQGNKRSLLADFVIGTVDQLLFASLKKKHFMLRHLGLTGKIVIVDEAHSYDSYMGKYLNKTLEWLGRYKVPVILLSATLPSKIRAEFIDSYLAGQKTKKTPAMKIKEKTGERDWETNMGYPLLTWTDGEKVCQAEIKQRVSEKQVRIGFIGNELQIVNTLKEKLENGGCACVILNTVRSAQAYYEQLKLALPEYEIMLYHSQFTLEDRLEKEKGLMERMGKNSTAKERNRFVLVGTQVLEQSLDYDADIMITQLCPIDLLLQRIGRLHRHLRTDSQNCSERPYLLQEPHCYILMDGEEPNGYDDGTAIIYGDYLLMRTEKVLPEYVNIPNDIPDLVQRVYDERDDLGLDAGDEYLRAKEEHFDRIAKKQRKAETFLLNRPRDGIVGMLTNPCFYDEEDGNRSVRDTEDSLEVILLRQDLDGIRFVGANEHDKCFRADKVPDDEDAYLFARQRVRLPGLFARKHVFREAVCELEQRQGKYSQWKQSVWLRGETFLILESDGTAELCGYQICYDKETGIKYHKKEGENNRG